MAIHAYLFSINPKEFICFKPSKSPNPPPKGRPRPKKRPPSKTSKRRGKPPQRKGKPGQPPIGEKKKRGRRIKIKLGLRANKISEEVDRMKVGFI